MTANRTVPKYGPFTVFLMVKTVRFLERYGSRYKILTENGNELCTVRFALFNEKTEHGGLFGAVQLAVKKQKRKTVFFCNGMVNAFL